MRNIRWFLQKLRENFLYRLKKLLYRLKWIFFYLRFVGIHGLWKDLFFFYHLSLLIWESRGLGSMIKIRMLLAIVLSRLLYRNMGRFAGSMGVSLQPYDLAVFRMVTFFGSIIGLTCHF